MNIWFFFIIAFLLLGWLVDWLGGVLTLKALQPEIPDEFIDFLSPDDYRRAQNYTEAKIRFSLFTTSVTTLSTLVFIVLGGFKLVDHWARSFESGPVLTGTIFTIILFFLSLVLTVPFSVYTTFVIEKRFGFNRTSIGTFLLDLAKTVLLAILLGTPLLVTVLWFFEISGANGWLYCWLAVIVFSLVIQFLAPIVILPLFNTFSPLADGDLKQRIQTYARRQHFQLQGIFIMDGSRRSTKVNAFFTGLGRFRKIVFYDTLLTTLDTAEIIAVLAHEMGHFKKRHLGKMLLATVVQTGGMLYLLSLLLDNEAVSGALQVDHPSVYASLIAFAILFSPVNFLISIVFHYYSRKYEFEADTFAITSGGDREALISALKKLSQANLGNLTPHPLVVLLEYSHPPVLQRIEAIRNIA
ncbi:MAG: M48 family metallopeptidase [Desulfopila sp.]